MSTPSERAQELRQAIVDFVMDAEDELATALETFSAAQMMRSQQDMNQRTLVVHRFVTEGEVGEETPISLFLKSEPDLSESDRHLVQNWQHSFVGLFAIVQILDDGFELRNWTTDKHYTVRQTDPQELTKMARLKENEILLTQIAPLNDREWMFLSPWVSLGRLGKPKLAVAIGNFKQNYKNHLYSDAPDLLSAAWESVKTYHQEFVEFFGSDEFTLSGYELNKKLTEFQEVTAQKRMEASGIDSSKSLQELAEEAGASREELEEAAEAMGADKKAIDQMFNSKAKNKMVAPQVELPPHLKKAEQVAALSHPQWGQMYLPIYAQLKNLLESDPQSDSSQALVRRALDETDMNAFAWHQLAAQYPVPLELLLQNALQRPTFQLDRDLDSLLREFNKPLEPELPEIASVPIHLHNLFQEAVLELSKDKSKTKTKKKASGFQR